MSGLFDEDDRIGLDRLDFATLEILDNYDSTWSVRIGGRDIGDHPDRRYANLFAGALVGAALGQAIGNGDAVRIFAIRRCSDRNPIIAHVVESMDQAMRAGQLRGGA